MLGLKKKVKVFLIEKGERPRFFKTKMVYNRDEKKWYVKSKGESIPTPENIFDYMKDNVLMIVRKGPNIYEFVNLKNIEDTQELEFAVIPPDELYSSVIKAELRKERNKSFKEKLLIYIAVSIVVVSLGIFLYIAWNSIGENMKAVSSNFEIAMQHLQNITEKQNELIEKILLEKSKGGELLPR